MNECIDRKLDADGTSYSYDFWNSGKIVKNCPETQRPSGKSSGRLAEYDFCWPIKLYSLLYNILILLL